MSVRGGGRVVTPSSRADRHSSTSYRRMPSTENFAESTGNCQGFVTSNSTDHATYFEGFVSSSGGALVHHGWLVVGGKVYDPTLELSAPLVSLFRESVAERGYFGVEFSTADVIRNFREREGKPFLMLPGITE